MKNFFYLLVCVSLFTFTSCNDDDDDPELTESNIEGAWNLEAYENDYTLNIVGLGTTAGKAEITNSDVIVTFSSADLTWTSSGDFTLEVTDADSTTTENLTGGIGSGTYSVENGNLLMVGIDAGDETDNDEPTSFRPTSYNPDSRFEGQADLDVTITEPFLGLTVSIDGDVIMELSR